MARGRISVYQSQKDPYKLYFCANTDEYNVAVTTDQLSEVIRDVRRLHRRITVLEKQVNKMFKLLIMSLVLSLLTLVLLVKRLFFSR